MSLDCFTTAARLAPYSPLPHEESGHIYEFHHDDRDEAIAALSRAVRRRSSRASVFYSLGTLRGNRGEHALAARLLRRATELDSGYFEAYNNLGNEYISLANAANIEHELQASRDEPQP